MADSPSQPSSLLSDLIPGTMVDGKYRVDAVIGRGGMGVVVAATHVHRNERVALKFLSPKGSDDEPEDFRARFEREARVCTRLQNEHIARVIDVGVWRDRAPYMVMRLLEGRDLRRAMKAKGRLPVPYAVEVAVQICEGLAEAHAQGIVHRDLKPPNIFLTHRADGSELVKVLDFGISKWNEIGGEELTRAGTLLGSPKYMSPEQLTESGVDPRSDVWSLGALLYEMLAGRPAYDSPTVMQTFVEIASGRPPPAPSTLEPSVPRELDAVILRCLLRDKDARVANVAELAGDLLDAIGSPAADETREQLRAVLDPSRAGTATIARSTSASRLALTSRNDSAASIAAPRAHETAAAPASPSTPPAPRSRARAMPWVVVAGGVAAAALLAFVVASSGARRAHGARSSAAATLPSLSSSVAAPPSSAPSATAAKRASATLLHDH